MLRDRRLGLVLAVAVLLRVVPWLLPHTFLGVQESDDGVYYAAADALLHGQLPYADVTIVHPPGVSVLLLPFAALGELLGHRVGLGTARVAIVLVAVANTLLVHRLALRLPAPADRVRAAALAAAAVYAVAPGAVVAEHTVLLEPLVTLFCLLAVLALPERPFLAGLLCVLGVSIKLFAGAYVVVLLVALLRSPGLRRYVLGLGVGTLVLLGPFFAAAPSAFWHDVVVTQLERPSDATDDGLGRLVDLTGLSGLGGVVGGLVLLVAVVAVVRSGHPHRLWLGLLLLGTVAFVRSPSYFPHYGAFLVPAVALVLHRVVAAGRTAAVALVVAVMAAGSVVDVAQSRGQDDWSAVGDRIPDGSCVFAELASYPIAAGVFAAPTDDCPGWVDGRGVAYTQSTDWPGDRHFYPDGFVEDTAWQAEMRAQMAAADWLLVGADVPEWDEQTRAYVTSHFRRVQVLQGPRHAAGQVWERTLPGR